MLNRLPLQPGALTEIRPLVPARRQDDKTQFYVHQTSSLTVGVIEHIPVPRGVRYVLIQAVGQNIRYCLSGTPSPTSGFLLYAGDPPYAISILAGITDIEIVAQVAGAQLNYQFCE